MQILVQQFESSSFAGLLPLLSSLFCRRRRRKVFVGVRTPSERKPATTTQ
ncbi:hypothetical protein BVRB_2g037360 [Beta vulgaris subsp. vulgaris]|nr:hypothetical protein BVRB_2g037360 [Beta vulgaris subsp. vulgaris]